ncbi:histidine phosphatase family protein [Mycetocola spongiae]|uniref:histidine phosphatase family protein n=1 Tax=Mycetocola spongiae TaxID=2859226 RepID=UPI001CF0EA6E|nr:histidine phosphatase family protein [Mycetocola spongiae]UCR87929.1 histidine phosphatase family protein [Mycetocola spongiae]
MDLTLIRHGQTDWNRDRRLQGATDIQLNNTGREQARAAAARLNDSFDVVVSSPLGRAQETAQLLAEGLNAPRGGVFEAITERGFGEAEGATREDVAERWPDGLYPGMETREETLERGLRGLEEIALAHPGQNVLAVSHGALIRLVASELRGTQHGPLDNLATVRLRRTAEGWSVLPAEGAGEDGKRASA